MSEGPSLPNHLDFLIFGTNESHLDLSKQSEKGPRKEFQRFLDTNSEAFKQFLTGSKAPQESLADSNNEDGPFTILCSCATIRAPAETKNGEAPPTA